MKTYQIVIRVGENEMEIKVEAKNWEEVVEYVMGRIEIIDKNE